MSDARVRVSLTDGVIEFEGSETFVASLVDKFGGVIRTALGGEQLDVNEEPAASAPPAPDDSLGDIFAETDDGVQVLKLLPRANKASRTVMLAKLYLYGLRKLKQRDTAMFGEIAQVCRAHGCFNSHNMAAYLKADRESFIFGGKAKRQTLKLSGPGMEGTEALIARIRGGGKGIRSRGQGIAARRQGIASRAEGIAADASQIAE